MIDTYLLLIGIIFLGGFGAYKVYKTFNEKTQISESENIRSLQEQKTKEGKIEESKPEPVFKLQTHNIKYWLYNPSYRATCKFNQAAKPISSKLNFLTF